MDAETGRQGVEQMGRGDYPLRIVLNDGQIEDLRSVMISALRYAIGRETYMPGIIQDFIRSVPDAIDANTRAVMIRDIDEHDHKKTYTLSNGTTQVVDGLGDTKIDRPGWIRLRLWLDGLEV